MIKVDGRKIAEGIVNKLKKLSIPDKKLVVVLAGDNPASSSFVKVKQKVAKELGIEFEICRSVEKIKEICERTDVGGVVVQLPLPAEFDRDKILSQLDPRKDVDNLTGKALVESPAVLTVEDILKEVNFDLRGKIVAVVGAKGFLIGQPVVRWFKKCKTADIETKDLKGFLADVDLVITGVGKKGSIDPSWLKDGAGIIDFGYPPDLKQGVIASDRLSASGGKQSFQHLGFYTPTPGGTGPILVAELFRNFYKLQI